ncbi:MAG: hypothetical protein M3P01_09065 [Actinomycetota bacterium]|nr:hypothetical protein [Actinomycetota bacterium]
MDTSNPRFLPGILAIGGGGLIIVGSFLPWIAATLPLVGTLSRNGLDGGGDGLISLGIGIEVAVMGLAFMSATSGLKRPDVFVGIGGGLAIVGAIFEYENVSNRISGLSPLAQGLAHVGSGIYVIGVGGILAAIASERMSHVVQPPPKPPEQPTTPPPMPE